MIKKLLVSSVGLLALNLGAAPAQANELPIQQDFYSASRSKSITELRRDDKVLKKQGTNLRAALKGTKKDKLPIYLQLGNLNLSRYANVFQQEALEYEQAYNAWRKFRKGKAPRRSQKRSQPLLAKAIGYFKKTVVKKYRNHPRKWEAQYALGASLLRHRHKAGVKYLTKVVELTNGVEEQKASLALGDYFFDGKNFDKAVGHYQNVIDDKESEYHGYAYLKKALAWQQRKQAESKVVEQLQFAVRAARDGKGKTEGDFDVKATALKELAQIWSKSKNDHLARAEAFFDDVDADESFVLFLQYRAGKVYREKNFRAAATTYAKLIEVASGSSAGVHSYTHYVSALDKLGRFETVTSTLMVMTDKFENNAEVKRSLYRYALKFHKEGQKPVNQRKLASAATLYSEYTKRYPKSKEAYNAQYYYADIMFEFKNFSAAAESYTKVVMSRSSRKLLRTAALNAVVSVNKIDAAAKHAKLPPAGQVPKAIDLPESKTRLVAALDLFVKVLPGDKAGLPMRLTAARTFFNYGHYKTALARFDTLIKKHPRSVEAKSAAKLVLAYHVEKGEWAAASSKGRAFIANKRLITPALKKQFTSMIRSASYNEARGLETKKKHLAAAKMFIRYQEDFPGDVKAPIALNDAARNFYKAGLLEDALAAHIKMSSKYPKSKLREGSMLETAAIYESLLQFARAAKAYAAHAAVFPRSESAATSAYKSALLFQGTNKNSQALRGYSSFRARYPADPRVLEAEFRTASILERQGQWTKAAQTFKSVAAKERNKERALFSEAKAAELTFRYIDRKKGRGQIWSVKAKLRPNMGLEARRVVASVLFDENEPVFSGYMRFGLKKVSMLDAFIKGKQSRLDNLLTRYKQVAGVNSPEYVVAAYYRMGEMYEQFAENLLNTDVPKNLDRKVAARLNAKIANTAKASQDKAFEFYETAYKRSQEVETFSEWTRLTYDRMASLAPKKYPEVFEQSAAPGYMVHRMSWDEETVVLVH